MKNFRYSQLETDDSIRLLYLFAGRQTDVITCWLFDSYAVQDNGPFYKALSYTWGSDEQPEVCIIVDGYQFMVKENLAHALRQIRQPQHGVILWVDAICINQADKREKGHQVKQMGRIYAGAEEVLIWLGPGIDSTASVMDLISRVDKAAIATEATSRILPWSLLFTRLMKESPEDSLPNQLFMCQKGLINLLEHPWFTRVWIIQEIANARAARILCGTYSCSARAFALTPRLLWVKVRQHTQAVLDIMPRVRKDSWYSSERYLHCLLRKFAGSHATEPRDNIYALLGISEDASSPSRFYPCYEKNDAQVYRDTASFLLFKEVLDTSYAFPSLQLHDLRQPLIVLAERVLLWTLKRSGDVASRATVQLLVNHLNEGRLLEEKHSVPNLLVYLSWPVKHADQVRCQLDSGFTLNVQFETDKSILYLSSRYYPSPSVALEFRDY